MLNRMSRRVLQRLLLWAALSVLALGALVAVLGWLAWRQLTPDQLVLKIEEAHNCRAEIEGCEVSLWPGPARVELTGVRLTPRDEAADQARPPAGRSPVKVKDTVLAFRRGVLEVELPALLLSRRLLVRELSLEGADVKADLLSGGENTLRPLFARPAKKDRKDKEPKPKAEAEEAEPAPVFNARDLKFSSTLHRVALVDSRLRFRNRKSKTVIELDRCTFEVTDIAVDPARLDTENRATLDLRTRLYVDSRKKEDLRYADIGLRLRGVVIPFEPATGNLNPDLTFETVFEKGTSIQGLPIFEKLQKNLDKARQAGLKLTNLQQLTELEEDAALSLRLRSNRFTLLSPATLNFVDYSLAMTPGSYLDAGTETHEFNAHFAVSRRHSEAALRGVEEFLAPLGEDAAASLRGFFIDPLVKDGRVAMGFTSKGDLDDPKVKIDHPLQDLKDQLEETGKDLLKSLKSRLFGGRELEK